MRVVCVSDTHGQGRQIAVPDGDVLVHAGDLTGIGTLEQITKEADWLRSLPHPHKVVIAGNHDFGFQHDASHARALMGGLVYLEDKEAVIGGLRFYGSPWQPAFCDWAFNLERGAPIRAKWDEIPAGIDVLVTHGPPAGVRDRTDEGALVGCADLRAAAVRVRPKIHVFGHIHEAYGAVERDGTRFVNASICDVRYRPVNRPIVVDL
jgi:Icc-related predicted phosphoesterase